MCLYSKFMAIISYPRLLATLQTLITRLGHVYCKTIRTNILMT